MFYSLPYYNIKGKIYKAKKKKEFPYTVKHGHLVILTTCMVYRGEELLPTLFALNITALTDASIIAF